MDPTFLQSLAPLGSYIFSIGACVYGWYAARQKDHQDDIDALRKELADLRRTVDEHDLTLKGLPTKDTVHALDISVTELRGGLDVVKESVGAIERTAHRIENFLLDQARK